MSTSRVVVATLATLVTIGAAPWRSLPECVIGKWSGITPMDEQGAPAGPADPTDWGCLTGAGPSAGDTRTFDVTPVPVPVPPPTDFCLYPAAPNPAFAATRMRFSVPRAGNVRLDVYAKKGQGPHNARLVRTLVDGMLAAGIHEVVWDGKDDAGVRLPADLYRVVMETEAGSLCGDLDLR